jgi:hypothetical protein
LTVSIVLSLPLRGEDTIWILAGSGDFFDPANWSNGVPGSGATTGHAVINNGGTATIGAEASQVRFAGFQLGQGAADTGHIVMLGGNLILNLAETIGSDIGAANSGAVDPDEWASFVMMGGTLRFGDLQNPDFSTSQDWRVGETGYGRFEVHGDGVVRIHDDLKIGAGVNGNGLVIVGDSANVTVGSGISLSQRNGGRGELRIGGSATVVSGNSLGMGSAEGTSDEGYLILSVRERSTATLVVEGAAVLSVRTLGQRRGVSTVTVRDTARFQILDVLHPGGGPELTYQSYLGAQADGDATVTVEGEAVMLVDSAGGLPGLTLAGGGISPGDNDVGGRAALVVRDRAAFFCRQALRLAGGTGATADATLEVRGPDGSVELGSLEMKPLGVAGAQATLKAVITGPSHTTVEVAGTASIAGGRLVVELDGYVPAAGDAYTLVRAGEIAGAFADVVLPELPPGLHWSVSPGPGEVTLTVASGAPRFRRGDADGTGDVVLTDGLYLLNYLFLQGPEPPCADAADADGDGALDITTAIFLFNFLFLEGPPPPPPGPESCGDAPFRKNGLACSSYASCAS